MFAWDHHIDGRLTGSELLTHLCHPSLSHRHIVLRSGSRADLLADHRAAELRAAQAAEVAVFIASLGSACWQLGLKLATYGVPSVTNLCKVAHWGLPTTDLPAFPLFLIIPVVFTVFLPMTGVMKFSEYLKNRRAELGWTQPEAAARAGIEQSYLSKLENGKSIPSEDVYQRLVAAFGIDTAAMAGVLYPGELDRLREIEAVRDHLLRGQDGRRSATRRWLFAGLAMLMIGGSFAGLAQIDRGGPTTLYTYQSPGVVRPGETLVARTEPRTISIAQMRGPTFTEAAPGGRREWNLAGGSTAHRPGRFAWAIVPGLALIIGGLGCFFISWRKP